MTTIKLFTNDQAAEILGVRPNTEYVSGFLQKLVEVTRPIESTKLDAENTRANVMPPPNKTLGVTMIPVTSYQATTLNTPQGKGQYIVYVMPGSVASRNGIQIGDVILKFDGKEINTSTDLQTAVRSSTDVASVEIIRARKLEKITVNFNITP